MGLRAVIAARVNQNDATIPELRLIWYCTGPGPGAGTGTYSPQDTVGDLAAELLAATEMVGTENDADDGGGGEAAAAVTDIFERVQSLAAENESLRNSLAEERASHLGLLEANRELEWRVKTGIGPGAPAAAMQEWKEAEAKLSLLLAENNELENRERQTAEELRRERATTAQLMASHAEALGVAQQAQNAADAADAAAREEAAASEGWARQELCGPWREP